MKAYNVTETQLLDDRFDELGKRIQQIQDALHDLLMLHESIDEFDYDKHTI